MTSQWVHNIIRSWSCRIMLKTQARLNEIYIFFIVVTCVVIPCHLLHTHKSPKCKWNCNYFIIAIHSSRKILVLGLVWQTIPSHYGDAIMDAIASHITSLTIVLFDDVIMRAPRHDNISDWITSTWIVYGHVLCCLHNLLAMDWFCFHKCK